MKVSLEEMRCTQKACQPISFIAGPVRKFIDIVRQRRAFVSLLRSALHEQILRRS